MITKRYKNGNMTFKAEKEELEKPDQIFEDFLYSTTDFDLEILGDEFCISNYEMGMCLYSFYTDMKYIVPFSLIDELKEGKTIRLYGAKLDEQDRTDLEERFSENE